MDVPGGAGDEQRHRVLTTSAAAFTELKQRLEALGYADPLGIETAPLVERLVSDLIATTDAYRSTKEDLAEAQSQSRSGENMVEPLQRHNARLLRENAKLHKDAIARETEYLQFKKTKLLNEKSLQDKLEQLLCVNDLSQETIKRQEQDIDRLRKRLLGVLKPLQQGEGEAAAAAAAVRRASGANKEPVQWAAADGSTYDLPKPPTIEMSKYLDGGSAHARVAFVGSAAASGLGSSVGYEQAVSRSEATLLAAANEQLDEAERANRAQKARIEDLSELVKVRDEEIQRLGEFLGKHGAKIEPATPEEMAAAEEERRSRVELAAEVEYLAAQTAEKTQLLEQVSQDLEATRAELQASTAEASEANRALQDARQAVDGLRSEKEALDLKLRESHAAASAAAQEAAVAHDSEVGTLRKELETLRERVATEVDQRERHQDAAVAAHNHVDAVGGAAQVLHHDNAQLRAELDNRDAEIARARESLQASRAAQAQLEARVSDLIAQVASARDEVAAAAAAEEEARARATALVRENATLTSELRHVKVSMSNLNTHVQGTEALLQGAKDELAVATAEAAEKGRIVADLRDELVSVQTKLKNAEDLSSRLARSQGSTRTEIVGLMKEVGAHKVAARRAEGQRDEAQGEISRLQAAAAERERKLQELSGAVRREEGAKHQLRSELVNASHSLGEAQRALVSLQAECRRLAGEVSTAQERLEGKTQESEALEAELARARADVEHFRNRVDDVSRAGETSHRAAAATRGELEELRHRVAKLTDELREARRGAALQQDELHGARGRLQTVTSEHAEAKSALSREMEAHAATRETLKAYRDKEGAAAKQVGELKSLFHELEETRERLEERVRTAVEALAAEKRLHDDTRERAKGLAEKSEGLERELERMQHVLRETDASRDSLQEELDSSAEARAKFAADRRAVDSALREHREELEAARKQTRSLADLLENREREFQQARDEAARAADEARRAGAEAGALRDELAAAAHDLQAMAKENAAVNAECASLREQQVQLSETIHQVRAAATREAQLKEAERAEKADILENYRAVCNERARLDVGSRGAQQSLQQVQAELHQAREAHQRLQLAFSSLQRSHRDSALENRNLQAKLSQQARKLYQATLQAQHAAAAQRQSAGSIAAAKSVASAAQGAGQQLRRDTAQLSFEVAAARHEIARLQASNQALSLARHRAVTRAKELELLLHGERQQFAVAHAALRAATGAGRGTSASSRDSQPQKSERRVADIASSFGVAGARSQTLTATPGAGTNAQGRRQFFHRDHLVVSDEEKRENAAAHAGSASGLHFYHTLDHDTKTDAAHPTAGLPAFEPSDAFVYHPGLVEVSDDGVTITPPKMKQRDNTNGGSHDGDDRHQVASSRRVSYPPNEDPDDSGTPSLSTLSSTPSTDHSSSLGSSGPSDTGDRRRESSSGRRRASPEAAAAVFEEGASLQELLGLDEDDESGATDGGEDEGTSGIIGSSADERGPQRTSSDEGGTTTSGEQNAAGGGGAGKKRALPLKASTSQSLDGLNGLFSAAIDEADQMHVSLHEAVSANEKLRTELQEKISEVRNSTSAAAGSAAAAAKVASALQDVKSERSSALEALGAARGKDNLLQKLASQLELELDAKDEYIRTLTQP
eukprot:INCI649.2.p1 GENE.INCI649.2~~INCI649.2.p1  ORF type:complete len:1639 (+),score=432.72 INCI649.2:206-5122(+)